MISSLYLRSDSTSAPLRIAVLADDESLIAPFAAVLRHIQASNFCAVVTVVKHLKSASGQTRARLPLMRAKAMLVDRTRRSSLLFSLYSRWDARRSARMATTFERIRWRPLLPDVPVMDVAPLTSSYVHRFREGDIKALRALDLDVILRFGFNILRGDILQCARYGVWSYHHGDNEYYRGGPALMWELIEAAPLSGACLQVLNERLDDGLVLAKTLSPTLIGFSRIANQISPYRGAEPLVIWKLHQLHTEGWEAVKRASLPNVLYRGKQTIYRTPGNRVMLKFLTRESRRVIVRSLSGKHIHRQWQIAIRPIAPGVPWENTWTRFRWIAAPGGHLFADPFLFERQGRTWLFVEDYLTACGKGVISCCEVLPDGRLGEWRRVLEQPYHLSFPHIFERAGVVYMLPETAAAGFVELYRAVDFPLKWDRDDTIMNDAARDTVQYLAEDGTQYFFSTLKESDEAQGQLFLFTADGLTKPWRVHSASPVTLDARYSRNGGALTHINNQLYRISQDSVPSYGSRLHFHKVTSLTPTSYAESLAGTCEPDRTQGFCGTHSYSRSSQWEAIDGLKLTAHAAT